MVGISVRKEEIAIMKLIGATDFLVRAPFIVEGIVIGLIGAATVSYTHLDVYKRQGWGTDGICKFRMGTEGYKEGDSGQSDKRNLGCIPVSYTHLRPQTSAHMR